MTPFTRHLLWASLLAIAFALGLFSLATLSQLADAADRLHAGAGQPVFWVLLISLGLAVCAPVVLLLRLPRALRYPAEDDAEVLTAYHARLRQHLARRPALAGLPLESEADMAHALGVLHQQAEHEVRAVAGSVLVSTALLQGGRLDALVVLVSQMRLVWRVAQVYGLRPSLRQMVYLYANVGACVLVAASLEEIDIAELTAPIVQSATPAALSGVPGLGGVGRLLLSSTASGAANAFLTLRVGLVAQAYCAPLHRPDRAQIRQSATRRAAALLGALVKDSVTRTTQAVVQHVKEGVKTSVNNTARGVGEATSQALQSTNQRIDQAARHVRNSGTALSNYANQAWQGTVARIQPGKSALPPAQDTDTSKPLLPDQRSDPPA